jgi:hypothetical protein
MNWKYAIPSIIASVLYLLYVVLLSTYGATYRFSDHLQSIITLIVEVLAVQLLIIILWRKRQQIKEFYTFSKFKLITTIALFIVIIVPPMIYDDVFFAAPWIWYILVPPMMLESTWLYWTHLSHSGFTHSQQS